MLLMLCFVPVVRYSGPCVPLGCSGSNGLAVESDAVVWEVFCGDRELLLLGMLRVVDVETPRCLVLLNKQQWTPEVFQACDDTDRREVITGRY